MTDHVNINPSSALYWLPRIEKAYGVDLYVPRTTTCLVPLGWLGALSEYPDPESQSCWDHAVVAIRTLIQTYQIRYPAFFRTDLASAKHGGPTAYRINGPDDVSRVMARTLEDNEMKWLSPVAFLIRQWLDLKSVFPAFHGHPIAREFRYFARTDRVECQHFYWVEDAIDFFGGVKEMPGWKERLASFAATPPPPELAHIAVRAARACPAAKVWSVDFAQDTNGQWWLIDMAIAEESYHGWDGCERPNNGEKRRAQEAVPTNLLEPMTRLSEGI